MGIKTFEWFCGTPHPPLAILISLRKAITIIEPLIKVPSYKFDEVKLGNKINHFDKYRREMCAEAVTAIVKRLTKCH